MRNPLTDLWLRLRRVRLTEAESADLELRIRSAIQVPVREQAEMCRSGYMDPRTFLRNAPRRITLTEDEDAAVFAAVSRFAQIHPPRLALPPNRASVVDVLRSLLLTLRPVPLTLAAFVFVACSTGVSLAAQSALPGDVLYPFKVHLNEKARAAFLFSSDSRAHFEASRLEKRLEEAVQLAAAGRLKGNLKTQVSSGIHAQLELVQHAAESLSESGAQDAALEIHTQVESDLVANAAVLASIVDASGNTVSTVRDLLQDVSDAERDVAAVRTNSQNKASVQSDPRASAEKSIQTATRKIESVRAFIQRARSSADGPILIQAEARFDFSKRLLSTARASISAGNYDLAIQSAVSAQRAAMEAQGMLRVSANVQPYLRQVQN